MALDRIKAVRESARSADLIVSAYRFAQASEEFTAKKIVGTHADKVKGHDSRKVQNHLRQDDEQV